MHQDQKTKNLGPSGALIPDPTFFLNSDDNLFTTLILFVYTMSNIDVIKNTTIPPIIIILCPDWSIFSRHFLNRPMRRENSRIRKV